MQAKHNLPQLTPPRNGQQNIQLNENLITLDDLYRHGDIDAAALVVGDMWLQLPFSDQEEVVTLIQQLSGGHNESIR